MDNESKIRLWPKDSGPAVAIVFMLALIIFNIAFPCVITTYFHSADWVAIIFIGIGIFVSIYQAWLGYQVADYVYDIKQKAIEREHAELRRAYYSARKTHR